MKKTTSAKKAATKKTPVKKTATKKAPPRKPAAKKTPVKKAAARKASSKKPSSKSEAEVAPKKATSKIQTASRQAQKIAETEERSEDAAPKKSAGFSMDDVRRILENKTSTAVDAGHTRKTKARKTAKKAKERKRKFSAASVADILGFNPNQKKTQEEQLEGKVPKKFLPYYRVLINLRDELRDGLDSHSQGTLLTSSKEESGDLSSNSSDSGSESFNRDVALSMVASEQGALHEVEVAIDRVFDGSFGICQETGKPIKRDRLKAVPFTRFSLEGQALHEQSDRRLVERGGIFTNLSEAVPGMPTDDDS